MCDGCIAPGGVGIVRYVLYGTDVTHGRYAVPLHPQRLLQKTMGLDAGADTFECFGDALDREGSRQLSRRSLVQGGRD